MNLGTWWITATLACGPVADDAGPAVGTPSGTTPPTQSPLPSEPPPTPDPTPPTVTTPPPTTVPVLGQDIETVNLEFDLTLLSGTATLQVQPDTLTQTVVLDVSGLTLSSVTVDGVAAPLDTVDGMLQLSTGTAASTIVVDYTFPTRSAWQFDGWMPSLGVSFIWPYFCGNLYPCDPSTTDGVAFTMQITGVPDGLVAIFPTASFGEGPAYMPGIALGDYVQLDLGETPAGTTLTAWYFDEPDGRARAEQGTAYLLDAFDFFEENYGPYSFGPTYGTVEVDWGWDSYGGMEHHPISHVGTFDLDDVEAQVHEAGHGWFGDGVRIACWEDFVLSEGTNTYITARAVQEVGGPDLWPYYVDFFLRPSCEEAGGYANPVVMPAGCSLTDFIHDDLWSLATYMKGACYYGEVADLVGADVLDDMIGGFYNSHVGTAAEMEWMTDWIEASADPAHAVGLEQLRVEWLETAACPTDYADRCRVRLP